MEETCADRNGYGEESQVFFLQRVLGLSEATPSLSLSLSLSSLKFVFLWVFSWNS
ncbi:hypothetical protein Bca101_020883 [Brassica carinata]